jgi:hypothetical protein
MGSPHMSSRHHCLGISGQWASESFRILAAVKYEGANGTHPVPRPDNIVSYRDIAEKLIHKDQRFLVASWLCGCEKELRRMRGFFREDRSGNFLGISQQSSGKPTSASVKSRKKGLWFRKSLNSM